MKLVLDNVSEGIYNKSEIHAFIQIKGDLQLNYLDQFQYCTFLNEQVLPVLLNNFKATNHIIHKFLYEDQGAPLSLQISSKTSSNNIPAVIKSLKECITASNKTLCDLSLKNNMGLFAQTLQKEDKSELNSAHHHTL
jgi:hypothetical protein